MNCNQYASEDNKFELVISFKHLLLFYLFHEEIHQGDILLYLDVNDKPLYEN